MRNKLLTIVLVCCGLTPAVMAHEKEAQIKRGHTFLVGLFDKQRQLLPEYRGSHVYWLYHDNYLAAKVLAGSHPDLSKKIQAAIRKHGVRSSGKIEILFGESEKPLPFRQFQLVDLRQDGEKSIRTERLIDREMTGWEAYADLRLFAALALAQSDSDQAKRHLAAALRMWDGKGFADPATKSLGIYSTYKLALAVLAANKLKQQDQLPAGLIAKLKSMQNKAGGWITDYRPNGTPVGKANVETSCLAILALETIAAKR